jgi:hypothetical protein
VTREHAQAKQLADQLSGRTPHDRIDSVSGEAYIRRQIADLAQQHEIAVRESPSEEPGGSAMAASGGVNPSPEGAPLLLEGEYPQLCRFLENLAQSPVWNRVRAVEIQNKDGSLPRPQRLALTILLDFPPGQSEE